MLDVVYDYQAAAEAWRRNPPQQDRRRDLFRFLPLLPLDPVGEAAEAGVPLAPGGTPLVAAPRLGESFGARVFLKDETRNPTRCLKDRATAIAVTLASILGQRHLYCASPGNAAISLAAFCAAHDLYCHVFVPENLSSARRAWLERFNADIRTSKGTYDEAFWEAEEYGRTEGWYSRNCALNPFLVEGKKTAAFEIAEEFLGGVPDLIICPVGDGCTLAAIGKGFRELRTLGIIHRLPKLVGVQPRSHARLVHRHQAQPPGGAPEGSTRAVSIAVQQPRNAIRLLQELAQTGGTMMAVSDDEIESARRCLAHKAGVVVEFSSAASLAGLRALARQQSIADKTAVLILTGGRTETD